jgi:tetratricopeptide (TPR) repeat protein/CHAT domain-containing protein
VCWGLSTQPAPLWWRRVCLAPFVLCLFLAQIGPGVAQSEDPVTLQRQVNQLFADGRHGEALQVAERYVEASRVRYGEAHVEYARALSWLADVHDSLGRYAQAEQLFAQTLGILEKTRGRDHPDVGATLSNLASVYARQGRFDEAHALYERTIAIGVKAFGDQHPNVGAVLNNVGELYKAQGRYPEAEAYYKRALIIGERALGADHLNVANGYINLAVLYTQQGRFAEAEVICKRVLATREKKLGPRHPDVAISLSSLGLIYAAQRQFADAEPLYKRALAIHEEVRGSDHPNVGALLNNLAELYREQKQYAEAEPLYKRALAIHEKIAGPDDISVSSALNNIALLYAMQDRYSDAEPLYRRALAIEEKALGPEHPSLDSALNNLAGLLAAQDRFADAEPLYKRALTIAEKTHGPEHQSVGMILASLAVLYAEKGDWPQAFANQRKATAVRTKLGEIAVGQEDRVKRDVLQGSNYFRFHVLLASRVGDPPALLSETFKVAQWALQSEASHAVAQMSARSAVKGGGLGATVRARQDLLSQRRVSEERFLAALGTADASAAENARKSIAALERRLATLDRQLGEEFPEYAQLAMPKPLDIEEARQLLNGDEALIAFLDAQYTGKLPEEAYLWLVTKTDARWLRLPATPTQIAEHVAALRCGLDAAAWEGKSGARCAELLNSDYRAESAGPLPFDARRAYELYVALFGQIEDAIKGKHLLIVPSGPLATLPFQVLVTTKPPEGVQPDVLHASGAWLANRHAITVLPSVAGLAALRKFAKSSKATRPFLGFGNPLLLGPDGDDRRAWNRQTCRTKLASSRSANRPVRSATSKLFRGRLANVQEILAQDPLPETTDELCAVAASSGAGEDAIYLGAKANERTIKSLSANGRLAQVRILHFATHGLLAAETEMIGVSKAEPALLLTPPAEATDEDDGLLTASEIAQLKIDADWVVLSACNTAASQSNKPGSEALSGLARAFFYAGARALLVSHWAVNSSATVQLVTRTFDEIKTDKKIGRAEALRRSMLALMATGGVDAHPSNWAPFIVVGEGGR